MPRKTVIAIGFGACIIVLVLLLCNRNSEMTKVQKDVAESLQHARALKAQRDSMEALVENKRFARTEEIGASAELRRPAGEIGGVGETDRTDEAPGTVRTSHSEPESPQNVPLNQPTPAAIADIPVTSGEGASVPADRFFTTAAMDGLTPQGKTTTFKTGDAVYLYAGVYAPQPEQLRVEWVDANGQVLQTAMVDVQQNTGPAGYRIYKYRTFSSAGKYGVRLYNSSGRMIGSTEFEVQ